MRRWMTWFSRVFFVAVFGIGALGKLLDNRGFADVVASYELSIAVPLLLPLALAVSLAELALAIGIAAGYRLALLAAVNLCVQGMYTVLAVVTNLRGLRLTNCGCFGVFFQRPMTWGTVVEDGVLTLLALGFCWAVRSPGRGEAAPSAVPATRAA